MPATRRLAAWTIGHSTLPIEEFLARLGSQRIEALADVRRFPGSRKHPQFNADTLAPVLRQSAIQYLALPELGGRRRARPDSRNVAWRNESFRGYADYMQTEEFLQNLERLLDMARSERVAIMCAEAVPWRCHRSLIADALLVRGVRVEEIVGAGACRLHALTPFAKVQGTSITYPPERPD